jgi:hypothetical protein
MGWYPLEDCIEGGWSANRGYRRRHPDKQWFKWRNISITLKRTWAVRRLLRSSRRTNLRAGRRAAGDGFAPVLGTDLPRRRRLIPLTKSTDSEDTKQGV